LVVRAEVNLQVGNQSPPWFFVKACVLLGTISNK
jgi:hypothetical protein